MSKLFISHASEDKRLACQLSNDLRVLGYSIWLDEWNIKVGQCIPSEIETALIDTRFLILLLSKHAVQSRWVDTEWKTAYWDEIQSRSIIVLPVLLENVQIPKLLQTKKYASLVLSYAVGFRELVSAIEYYEGSAAVASEQAQHSARENPSDGFVRKPGTARRLTLATKPESQKTSKLNNVVNIGGNVNNSIVANKVQVSGKGALRMTYPAGSVGASVYKKNYLDYLIKRYYDYRKADPSFAALSHSQRFHHAEIHTTIQSKFKAKTFFVSESQFEQLCAYIKARIDRTILGKRNKSRGIRNYSSFEEQTVTDRTTT